ncbi:MAG: acetyl-CoA carboxylase biotin carboxylase subunit [Alphaproteobacteria bacterium]|nr:acetyl-CoA carboxylase biotin carboxylase subunit [Alphaproteobacteria bacterium]
MFSKILIANRGEIACRVIRSAKRMGIATVAVYSEADADALHVEMADEAVAIGPAPSSESYLVIDNIMQAIGDTGADAVHPGYGFLSENAAFAEALDAAGVAFIGPGPRAIAAMGDKIESKRLAEEAGVATVPGRPGVIADADEAVTVSKEIGYPVMLKASAGGGGKGMRIARDDDGVRESFRLASSEARSSFGDDRIFIEKFVENPRHIEIQILADSHGNTIYLGERECSIQRRHQKVIEEAPSPFIDPETRAAMGAQAVALAQAVDYKSAGTVEFIVDGDRNFYFLEMNTRLQVEHPVTELVTGVDLVEQMIRVAAGETLSITQDDVGLEGWAMETRIYAEDPFRNFLPSTGRLVRYRAPAENDRVRVDTGVTEGGEISIFYDPMIAKLITSGATRDDAIAQMRDALDAYYIRGVSHNIPFLAAVLAHPRFASGNISTAFIDDEYADGFSTDDLVHGDPRLIVAVAAAIDARHQHRRGRVNGHAPALEKRVAIAGERDITEYALEISGDDGAYAVGVDGQQFVVRGAWRPGDPLFRGAVNDVPVCIQVERHGTRFRLSHAGGQMDILIVSERVAALNRLMPIKEPPDMSRFLLSPMPGLLIRLSVAEGDAVKAGEELAIVEAMKMENVLRAEQDGTVKELLAGEGDSLMVDQPILEFI